MRCTYYLDVIVRPSPGLRSFSKTLCVYGTIPIGLHRGDEVQGLPGPKPWEHRVVDYVTWNCTDGSLTINLEDAEMPSNAEAEEVVKILIRSGWADQVEEVEKILAEHDRKEEKKKGKSR
jgi:hypothetical protein